MHKMGRLAVRIPFVGWEAHISSKRLEETKAKIANMSTGGAYLITEVEYEPGSIVTLWVRSSQTAFFVTAQVLRNNPFGVAVCFLDLCESTRSSILEIITRFLSRRKPEKVAVEKTPVVDESRLGLNCNL